MIKVRLITVPRKSTGSGGAGGTAGLGVSLLGKLDKAVFDELFEKVNIGTDDAPVWAIRAKYGLYSDSFISALGANGDAGGGGTGYERLDSWEEYGDDKAGWVLSALLGYALHTRLTAAETAVTGKVDKEDGMGLSSNDFTDSQKEKIEKLGHSVERVYSYASETYSFTQYETAEGDGRTHTTDGKEYVGLTLRTAAGAETETWLYGWGDFIITGGQLKNQSAGTRSLLVSRSGSFEMMRAGDTIAVEVAEEAGVTAGSANLRVREVTATQTVFEVTATGYAVLSVPRNTYMHSIRRTLRSDTGKKLYTFSHPGGSFTLTLREGVANGWATTLSAYGITDGVSTSRRVAAGDGLAGGGSLSGDIKLSLAPAGTAGTYTKVTTDEYGRVTAGGGLAAGDIPMLDIGQIDGLAAVIGGLVEALGGEAGQGCF